MLSVGVGITGLATSGADPLLQYAVGAVKPEILFNAPSGLYYKDGLQTDFAGLFAYLGVSESTQWNAQGYRETVAADTPRTHDYVFNGSVWVNRGIRLESDEGYNDALDSEDPSTGNWSGPATVTKNLVALDGTANAGSTITDDDPTAFEYRRQDITIADDSNPHCVTAFVAKDSEEGRFPELRLQLIGGTTVNSFMRLNTATGAFDSPSIPAGVLHRVENWGDRWKCTIATVNNGTGNTTMRFAFYPAMADSLTGGISVTVTGSTGLLGIQMEPGIRPSSYNPTGASAFTRTAQDLNISSANMPAYTTALSVFLKGLISYEDEGSSAQAEFWRWLTDGSNYARALLLTNGARTGRVQFQQAASGTSDTIPSADDYFGPGANVPFSMASRHTSGAINAALDGVASTEDTTPVALADLSAETFQIGRVFDGHITEGGVFNVDIGNAGIEQRSA